MKWSHRKIFKFGQVIGILGRFLRPASDFVQRTTARNSVIFHSISKNKVPWDSGDLGYCSIVGCRAPTYFNIAEWDPKDQRKCLFAPPLPSLEILQLCGYPKADPAYNMLLSTYYSCRPVSSAFFDSFSDLCARCLWTPQWETRTILSCMRNLTAADRVVERFPRWSFFYWLSHLNIYLHHVILEDQVISTISWLWIL